MKTFGALQWIRKWKHSSQWMIRRKFKSDQCVGCSVCCFSCLSMNRKSLCSSSMKRAEAENKRVEKERISRRCFSTCRWHYKFHHAASHMKTLAVLESLGGHYLLLVVHESTTVWGETYPSFTRVSLTYMFISLELRLFRRAPAYFIVGCVVLVADSWDIKEHGADILTIINC